MGLESIYSYRACENWQFIIRLGEGGGVFLITCAWKLEVFIKPKVFCSFWSCGEVFLAMGENCQLLFLKAIGGDLFLYGTRENWNFFSSLFISKNRDFDSGLSNRYSQMILLRNHLSISCLNPVLSCTYSFYHLAISRSEPYNQHTQSHTLKKRS